MDIASTVLSAVIASVVAASVNALFFVGVQRRFVERDRVLEQLGANLKDYRQRVEKLDTERIAELDARITAGAHSRKEIHEHIRDNLVTRAECSAHKQQLCEGFGRIEKRLDGLSVQVGETNAATARMTAVYEIVQRHITIGGTHQAPARKGASA
jgi:hypothetical protein